MQSTDGLHTALEQHLRSESRHRELIRAFSQLAARDTDKVLLAAFGLCGLRAIAQSPGCIATHRPIGMSRKIYREKERIAKKLAARSYALVHGG